MTDPRRDDADLELPRDELATLETAAARGLTTPRAAGVAGIVFAVLFALALLFLRQSWVARSTRRRCCAT